MPVVNLDVVSPDAVTIARSDGQQWTLAPDVPAAVMVRTLYLAELMAEQVLPDPAELEARGMSLHEAVAELERRVGEQQAKIEAETLRIFAGIWRWTYPDASDEFLRASFSHRERYAVVDAFFAMRSARSATAPNASTPSSPATASGTASEAAPTPNRAQRRTASRKTRSATR